MAVHKRVSIPHLQAFAEQLVPLPKNVAILACSRTLTLVRLSCIRALFLSGWLAGWLAGEQTSSLPSTPRPLLSLPSKTHTYPHLSQGSPVQHHAQPYPSPSPSTIYSQRAPRRRNLAPFARPQTPSRQSLSPHRQAAIEPAHPRPFDRPLMHS